MDAGHYPGDDATIDVQLAAVDYLIHAAESRGTRRDPPSDRSAGRLEEVRCPAEAGRPWPPRRYCDSGGGGWILRSSVPDWHRASSLRWSPSCS
ncbi:hypothetical protein ACGFMO_03420 [Streptomyces niveus]|uniref:hypothetical protein n=1 Tax=Streptomyces niveus TaxID=193462 RepID=UPI00371358D8